MRIIDRPTSVGTHWITLGADDAIIDPSRYHGPDDPVYIYGPKVLRWDVYPSGTNVVVVEEGRMRPTGAYGLAITE